MVVLFRHFGYRDYGLPGKGYIQHAFQRVINERSVISVWIWVRRFGGIGELLRNMNVNVEGFLRSCKGFSFGDFKIELSLKNK